MTAASQTQQEIVIDEDVMQSCGEQLKRFILSLEAKIRIEGAVDFAQIFAPTQRLF